LVDVERNWAGPTLSTLAERIRAVKVRQEPETLRRCDGDAVTEGGSYWAGCENSGWDQSAVEVESRSCCSGWIV
jgi:hypothetical protein